MDYDNEFAKLNHRIDVLSEEFDRMKRVVHGDRDSGVTSILDRFRQVITLMIVMFLVVGAMVTAICLIVAYLIWVG